MRRSTRKKLRNKLLFEALTKYGVEAYMFGTSSTTHGNQSEFGANCALRFVKDQLAK